jgi:hypothetical protein
MFICPISFFNVCTGLSRTYIKKSLKGGFNTLFFNELHEINNEAKEKIFHKPNPEVMTRL